VSNNVLNCRFDTVIAALPNPRWFKPTVEKVLHNGGEFANCLGVDSRQIPEAGRRLATEFR
jgi:hypothetical protein